MAEDRPKVVIETSMGDIEVELWPDRSPRTVENFLQYVDDGFYEGTIFHRVIPNFMVQGGGLDRDLNKKRTRRPIQNEATAEKKNERGTLAMARTTKIDSATSQFFINLADNDFLDHTGESPEDYGYAVFGEVVDGMDVVDEMAEVETTQKEGRQNVPVRPVVINSVRRIEN
jgi:peptidyl-prolyl cis-trans isomerase B (cyclophilin B)